MAGKPFLGFSGSKAQLTPVPAEFFRELLGAIDSLAELKVTLAAVWLLNQQQEKMRYLRREDFLQPGSGEPLAETPQESEQTLDEGLPLAVARGTLLAAPLAEPAGEVLYFLNTPRGRGALRALQTGAWQPDLGQHETAGVVVERPNIFKLYEDEFGPLTPLVADTLRDMEQLYPQGWIEEGMRIAVQANKRSLRYVEAILRSWQEKGRDEKDRRDPEKDRRRFIEGEYSDFIEH